jgi:inner membrane protein
MDNLTHTLAGVLIGEAIARFLPAGQSGLAQPQRRNVLVVLSAVCSNLPDSDLLYTISTGNKLDYLSQHRGYTHTIVGILVAAALAMLAVELWLRWRRLEPTRSDRRAILTAVGLALVVHLALDATNSYGVHPFWPVHNHWLYGDAVFIIEPLLWTCAAPLLFLLRSVVGRALMAAVLAAALALSFATEWILPASGLVLGALMLGLLVTAWKASATAALLSALGAWLVVTATFFGAGELAARRVAAEFSGPAPRFTLLDHVLTPMPANPLCWNVIAVLTQGDRYALRRGVISTAPGVISAQACPDRSLDAPTTAPLRRLAESPSAAVRWLDEYTVGRADFARIIQAYCDAAILMRFARAPWLAEREGGWAVGDLRYDREPELGFAEIELGAQSRACSTAMPPWVPPRRDLAQPPG